MFTLIVINGGAFDYGKIGNNITDLKLEAKGKFLNSFDPDYNQCIIINKYGDILFDYEKDVYSK